MSKKTGSSAPYPTQQQPAFVLQPQPIPPQNHHQPYPMYPMANPTNIPHTSNPYYGAPMPGMPPPPPSYDQAMHHPVAPPNYVPQQMQHQPQNYPYHQQPHQQPQMTYVQPQIQPQTTFVVHNAFDAGARFDSSSQVRIPPPPPGVAPNVAQMAQSSGHNVVAGQRQDRWVMGGSDGGAVFW